MPITRDLSDLPAGTPAGGRAPDRDPVFARRIVDAWLARYLADGNDELAFAFPDTRFRASWASGCARKLGYAILANDAKRQLAAVQTRPLDGTDDDLDRWAEELERAKATVAALAPTDPMGVADFWRFSMGTAVHDMIQGVLADAYPDADIELPVDLRPLLDGSGTIDVVVREQLEHEADPFVTVVEIKSINGFGFKMAATAQKGPPEGPRHSAVVQGALTATALDADRLIVIYFSLENLSPGLAAGMGVEDEIARFVAQWTYGPEEFRPLAEREHARVNRILEVLGEGKLPPRALEDPEVPRAARITDPRPANKPDRARWEVVDGDGKVTQVGTTWVCGYCDQRQRCIDDGPGTPVYVGTGHGLG
jgi:hypothetical protein